MDLTAETILARLQELRSDEERKKYHRYFDFEDDAADTFIGVRMGQVFALAKQGLLTPPAEIEKLMESDIHEARAAAMSIMAKQYQAKKTTPERKQELFELYLRRHDRINGLGPGRSRGLLRHRAASARAPARYPLSAGQIGESVGAAHRHPRHLRIHPPRRARRHLRHCRAAAR